MNILGECYGFYNYQNAEYTLHIRYIQA